MITNSKRIYKNTSVLIIAQNVRKDKKLKEEIRKFKERHKKFQNLFCNVDIAFNEINCRTDMENEAIKMTNLNFEKSYSEQYLKIFMTALIKEDIDKIETKYNIKRVNEHLIKIIEEYKQLTDELDEAIFGKAGV